MAADHLKGFGITVGDVKYDRTAVAKHAEQLVSNVAKNLGNSLSERPETLLTRDVSSLALGGESRQLSPVEPPCPVIIS